jgi:hypothetical protein
MTDQASSTPKPAKGDERNVVAVDPNAPQATLEERLAIIWAENRAFILGGIVLVIAVIIGRAVWDNYMAARERAVQEAFGRAETAEAKLAFARENAKHSLAGVAVIGAADAAYAEADYATASSRYAQAAGMLDDPLVRTRARLGEAVATLQGGSAEKGEQLLRAVAADAAAPEPIRAEAWYHVASYNHAAGNIAAAREALAKVNEVSPGGLWASRASVLERKLPPETEAPAGTP